MTSGARARALDFRILGPLDVVDGARQLPLGKPRTRAVLAAFLLHANEPLARERLVDLVWGETPPKSASASLYNCVSQLRRALGPERLPGDAGAYRLLVAEGELDRDRFERLVAEGQAAFAAGSAERAASVLAEALALWRGDPLEDLRYEPFAQTEIRRLEELRLTALESRIEADLACGRHETLVPELEALVAAHPWRERLHAQLMLALYRSGRQADALEGYRSARAALDEELGLEPSGELRELERRILQHDSTLELADTAAPARVPLPANRLVGRRRELAELRGLLDDEREGRLVTLVGPGGVGKTRLALELAAAETTREVVLADLSPLSEAEQVLPTLAYALGVRATGGRPLSEAAVERARSLGECLLVVDNCEHVLDAASDISALAAGCPSLRLLATSREPLHVAAEREFRVEPLDQEDALALFVERGRRAASSFEADGAALEICRRLDFLPLALELAAARVKTMPPAEIRRRLDEHLPVLPAGPRDAPARQRTLRATIEWSHDLLEPEERDLFAAFAVFAGGATLEAIEHVCSAGLDAISSLVDKSLLRLHAGRYWMLETIREYADERLQSDGDTQALSARHAEYFLTFVERVGAGDDGNLLPWLPALDAETGNVRAALTHFRNRSEYESVCRIAVPLAVYWTGRNLPEGRLWLAEGARTADLAARAKALSAGARLALRAGDVVEARRGAVEAVAVARRLGDDAMAGRGLHVLASVVTVEGNLDEATRLFEESRSLLEATGNRRELAGLLVSLSYVALLRGAHEQAITRSREAIDYNAEFGRREHVVTASINLGYALLARGQPEDAQRAFRDALDTAAELQDNVELMYSIEGLAAVLVVQDAVGAVGLLGAADKLRAETGVELEPFEQRVHEQTVEAARTALAELDFERVRAEGRERTLEETIAIAIGAVAGS